MKAKRHTNTKNAIKSALTRLLRDQAWETLSISEISQAANINRGTFYLHYKDKEDMMNQLLQGLLDHVSNHLANIDQQTSWQPNILPIIEWLEKDFDFIESVVKARPDYIENILRDYLWQLIQTYPSLQQYIKNQIPLPTDYAYEVFIASNISIALHWIKKGGKEDPEQVSKMFFK